MVTATATRETATTSDGPVWAAWAYDKWLNEGVSFRTLRKLLADSAYDEHPGPTVDVSWQYVQKVINARRKVTGAERPADQPLTPWKLPEWAKNDYVAKWTRLVVRRHRGQTLTPVENELADRFLQTLKLMKVEVTVFDPNGGTGDGSWVHRKRLATDPVMDPKLWPPCVVAYRAPDTVSSAGGGR